MNSITISEFEYLQLQATIRQLTHQLSVLQLPKPAERPRKVSVAHRLHGVLAMPKGFDEKQILEDEILKKHLAHG